MKRKEAIKKIAAYNLRSYSDKNCKETIEPLFLNRYEIGDKDIAMFSEELQREICSGVMPENCSDRKYDPIILDDIEFNLIGATNGKKLAEAGIDFDKIEGLAEELEACPCCGYKYKILDVRGDYDICRVCFWEDDGVNNPEDYSGPNHLTLGEGRDNFEAYGACDKRSLEFIDKDGTIKFYKSVSSSEEEATVRKSPS